MASSASQADSRVVPVLQAGGGTASSIATIRKIDPSKEPVSSYLSKIYDSFGTESSKSSSAAFVSDIQQDSTDTAFTDHAGFLDYMSSPAAAAMGPHPSTDLSRPITNYFISTSHNTYLSGNQLYGEASTGAYTNVLVRGCRSLEIDVWDGESNSDSISDEETGGKESSKGSRWSRLKARARSPHRHEQDTQAQLGQPPEEEKMPERWRSTSAERRVEPRVLHGHTLTKEVSFRAVCHAIKDSAFVASDLPLIVSLEVHAGLDQQEIMVEIMRETWKGLLVDLTAKEKDIEHLPSPEQLRSKILIKVKYNVNPKTGESNDPQEHVENDSSDGEEIAQTATHASSATPQKKKASKILQALSDLGVYTRAYSFKHFNQPEASIPTHVFSLSEKKVVDMHETHGSALFNHNRNYMMRVFPSGLRVNSSNVDPTFLWQQGAQMVALNWQKWDAGMMLNEGMFTGGHGWVLKPSGYHSTSDLSSAPAQTLIKRQTLDLTIEVLAGQNIPLPADKESSHLLKFHPYLKFQLHVDNRPTSSEKPEKAQAEDKENSDKLKRRSKTAKGTDPDFFGETMRWSNVTNVIEQLSFLRVKIQDDKKMGKDELGAWACIRLDRLRPGFRFIHLLDCRGMQSSGVLLVKISKCLS